MGANQPSTVRVPYVRFPPEPNIDAGGESGGVLAPAVVTT